MSLLDRLRPDLTTTTTAKGHPTSTSRTAPDRSEKGRSDKGRSVSAGSASGRSASGRSVTPTTTRAAARAAEATGVVMAALTGVWTAALSWLCLTLPVLLVWAASPQTTAPWGQAVRVSTDGWLLLHRIGVDVPGGRLGLLPLALAALPLALCWTAGRRLGAALSSAPGDPLGGSDGSGARRLARALAPSLGGFALGYAAVTWLAALLARGDGVAPVPWQALVLGPIVPLLGAVPAALRAVGAPVVTTLADLVRLPARVRRTAPVAATVVAALVAVGALLVALAVAVHHDRVATLHTALAPGLVGGTVLLLAQAALVPNLAVWGVSFVAGPGFVVGAGGLVTPAGSQLSLLPLVPVLGAVPPPGPMPALVGALPLLPLLAGAFAGWTLARRGAQEGEGVLDVVCDALTAAPRAAAAVAVLVAVSSGPAGPGTLASVGASPWRAGLALAGELAAGAAAAAWITHRRRPV